MSNFEELVVWKKAHLFVLEIYKILSKFPDSEKYGLTDQLRRASTSIPINICEGTGRNSDKEFRHFLYISRGSLYETKYELLLAKDLKYINESEYLYFLERCNDIGKQLNALIKSLDKSNFL